MEFFGLTHYGPQNYLKDTLHEYYKEPTNFDEVKPMMQKVLENSNYPKTFERPDINIIRTIDVYIGRVNGFAYGSMGRFNKMKTKGVVKPVGPGDMHRITPITSYEHGWFFSDPAIAGKNWFLCRPRHPAHISENTKILDIAKKANKNASFF